MKNLLFKNGLFYLSDEVGKNKGKTKSVSGYNIDTISNTNMPHTYFNTKIVIYGRNDCPYCKGILSFLKKKPLLYKKVVYVNISNEPIQFLQFDNLLKHLQSDTTFKKDHETVPIVFNKGIFIGGCDDSKIYFSKKV